MNQASRLASPVVELRQYTLKPGQRETLIGLFDRELVETQEATGMTVIGQFRDLDRPDMFVWLRGFEDMETRKDALTAFYGGPVWAAHRDAANATMIDSDDVLLLKPAWQGAGFDLSGLCRPTATEAENKSRESRLSAIVEIEIHHLRPGTQADFAGRFQMQAVPQLAANGARLLGAFISEHAENTFPRLPVRTADNVFIAVTGVDDYAARHAPAAWRTLLEKARTDLTGPTEVLRLSPTSRSLIGQ
ncbi:NIPSNAP protein [Mesorhizobium sp. NFR06]|nr:NIPSNAP family protein [Mesorhizobium sp. NFR06]SFP33121.1 NIPSNAP protein [Mesorhizobium sp. NFR06]